MVCVFLVNFTGSTSHNAVSDQFTIDGREIPELIAIGPPDSLGT